MFGLYVDRFRLTRVSNKLLLAHNNGSKSEARCMGLVVWGPEIWLPHVSLIADELTGKGSRVTY